MLYILTESNTSRGGNNYHLAVEAANETEAEKLANEYIKQDARVLTLPLLSVKMIAYESLCPIVITKENLDEVCESNPYRKPNYNKLSKE